MVYIKCLQQLVCPVIVRRRLHQEMRSGGLPGRNCHCWRLVAMPEQPPISVYSAGRYQKGLETTLGQNNQYLSRELMTCHLYCKHLLAIFLLFITSAGKEWLVPNFRHRFCSPRPASLLKIMQVWFRRFNHSYYRVQSRNECLGGKMVRGKCTLGRGLGPSLQKSVIVPLSKHIYSSVSTGRQELSLSPYFKLHLGKRLGGSLSVWGRSFPPTPHPQ